MSRWTQFSRYDFTVAPPPERPWRYIFIEAELEEARLLFRRLVATLTPTKPLTLGPSGSVITYMELRYDSLTKASSYERMLSGEEEPLSTFARRPEVLIISKQHPIMLDFVGTRTAPPDAPLMTAGVARDKDRQALPEAEIPVLRLRGPEAMEPMIPPRHRMITRPPQPVEREEPLDSRKGNMSVLDISRVRQYLSGVGITSRTTDPLTCNGDLGRLEGVPLRYGQYQVHFTILARENGIFVDWHRQGYPSRIDKVKGT